MISPQYAMESAKATCIPRFAPFPKHDLAVDGFAPVVGQTLVEWRISQRTERGRQETIPGIVPPWPAYPPSITPRQPSGPPHLEVPIGTS